MCGGGPGANRRGSEPEGLRKNSSGRGVYSCETDSGTRNRLKLPRRNSGNHKFSTVERKAKINAG